MRYNYIFLLMAISVAVSACTSGDESTEESFFGGKEGIKLSFLPNTPPSEVTDFGDGVGFPFQAVVTVENVGEQNLKKDELDIEITGFFPTDFAITETEQLKDSNDALRGVDKDPDGKRVNGGIQQFIFPVQDKGDAEAFKYMQKLKGNQQFPFKAEACYKYKTTAVSQLCLQESFTDNLNQVCNPKGPRVVSNSGAPVHVTSITESVGGTNKIILNFEIKKVGLDDVFKLDDTNKCSTDFTHRNRVKVTVNTGLESNSDVNIEELKKNVADAKTRVSSIEKVIESYTGNNEDELSSNDDILSATQTTLTAARTELAKYADLNCVGLLEGTGGKSGFLLLIDNKASFTCIQTLGENSMIDSVKSFNVVLEYYAERSITKNVLVKHLIGD